MNPEDLIAEIAAARAQMLAQAQVPKGSLARIAGRQRNVQRQNVGGMLPLPAISPEQSANYSVGQQAQSGLPEGLGTKVGQSMQQFRMSTDPMAARWRAMLANPAADPMAGGGDTEEDAQRKAALLAAQQQKNAQRFPGGQDQVVAKQNDYYKNGGYAADSMRRRQAGAPYADAQKKRNLVNAYNRGKLNPEMIAANEELLGIKAQKDAEAARISQISAAGATGKVDPLDSMTVEWFKRNPAAFDAYMNSKVGGGQPPAPVVPPPPATVTRTKPQPITPELYGFM